MNRRKPYISRDGETRLQAHRGGWPGPRKVDVTFGLDPEALAAIEAYAGAQTVSRAVVLRRAIDQFLTATGGTMGGAHHGERASADTGGEAWAGSDPRNGQSATGRLVGTGGSATPTAPISSLPASSAARGFEAAVPPPQITTPAPVDRWRLLTEPLTPTDRERLAVAFERFADHPGGSSTGSKFLRLLARGLRHTVMEAAR